MAKRNKEAALNERAKQRFEKILSNIESEAKRLLIPLPQLPEGHPSEYPFPVADDASDKVQAAAEVAWGICILRRHLARDEIYYALHLAVNVGMRSQFIGLADALDANRIGDRVSRGRAKANQRRANKKAEVEAECIRLFREMHAADPQITPAAASRKISKRLKKDNARAPRVVRSYIRKILKT